MRTTLFLALLGAVALVACEKRDQANPRPTVSRALRGVLVYPLSTEVSIAAGTDAGQATLTTPETLTTVAAWFRQALKLNGWTLQSDLTGRDGTVTLYAEQAKRPLWITLKANVGGPGTTYTVIGGIVGGDTVK